jgi:hypothetical protein
VTPGEPFIMPFQNGLLQILTESELGSNLLQQFQNDKAVSAVHAFVWPNHDGK